ncbi:MAG: hypothetical protein ACMXYC_01195 [Candidatus Woesearchaeota archaeon]
MKEYDIQKLIHNPDILEEKILDLLQRKLLFRQHVDRQEIAGHILKAEHNLRFVADVFDKKYFDWALTGCYYSCYHIALALIQTKGYTSKNHFATLCIIIKEFYKKELTIEDIEIFTHFLEYEDILFYVQTKNKREDATYSTKTKFDKKEVEHLRMQAILFIHKTKDIIKKQIY